MPSYELLQTREGVWHVCDQYWNSLDAFPSLFHALRCMRTLQNLPTCHDFLIDQGAYTWEHIDADYDDGDAENGPSYSPFSPDYDLYHGDYETLIFQCGTFLERQVINWSERNIIEEFERESAAFYAANPNQEHTS